MREFFPLKAKVKPQLPVFLNSQVDKTSTQYMCIMIQMRTWWAPHFKARCWYIECGKTICPVDKEEMKIAYEKANSRSAKLGSDHIKVLEEVNEIDLSLLPEKEKNKILNQRAKDAKKATD